MKMRQGTIAGVDVDSIKSNYFKLKLVNKKGVYYAMRYDAIHNYMDVKHNPNHITPPGKKPRNNKRWETSPDLGLGATKLIVNKNRVDDVDTNTIL